MDLVAWECIWCVMIFLFCFFFDDDGDDVACWQVLIVYGI